MSISSTFLWRFLEDVWDLLPSEDRQLFEAYWSGQLQVAANLEQKTIEAGLSTEMANVPVFLTERWERFVMNEDSCDLFTQTDALTLLDYAEVAVSKETVFPDTLKVTNSNGRIFHEETIRFFDNAAHGLRYGKIVPDTLSVSISGFSTSGTGATITALDTLVDPGAFADVSPEMVLKISAATPSGPIGVYKIRAVLDSDTVAIYGSFSVASATGVDYVVEDSLVEYTSNRDFAVNLTEGTIQAIDEGRIPPTELLVVRYFHEEYTRALDYELDEVGKTVRRLVGTTIPSGASVSAIYTYNGTATLPMTGSRGAVSQASLTDTNQDFSTLLDDRTLTVLSGPNAGTYSINAVISTHEIQTVESFPVDQETDVEYSIDAFPHGIKVASNITSIPYLQDLVDSPTSMFIENVDYVISAGLLSIRSALLLSEIGPSEDRERQAWAETVLVDEQTPYRNFGVLIDFFRNNSEEYKLALQGLWYTFWTGSTPGNLGRGLHILLGLPFARSSGTVTLVDVTASRIDVTDSRGQIITYTIPSDLDPAVALGDEISRFTSLTTGVEIVDRNNEPGFVTTYLGRAGVERFLTDNASRGLGTTDETKALALLENHLFLPQVLTAALSQRINVDELVTFLDNMKPQWSEYVFSINSSETEGITVSGDPDDGSDWLNTDEIVDTEFAIDLSATVGNNQINQSEIIGDYRVQSGGAAAAPPHTLVWVAKTTGVIPYGGTQAGGNFQDSGIDFADLGIDKGDIVRINSGTFKGVHLVLARISSSTLSLDIPDASITFVSNVDYVIFPEERMLDHDAVNLRDEHMVKAGTDYPGPGTLNTKTDVDFASTSLTNDRVKALLLVDVGMGLDAVQAITDALVEISEFDVAVSPGTVTRDHEIASAALKRTLNTGPTVTDAYAI